MSNQNSKGSTMSTTAVSQVAARLYVDLENNGGIQWLSFRDLKDSPAVILVARGQFACDLMDTMMAAAREKMEQILKLMQAKAQPK